MGALRTIVNKSFYKKKIDITFIRNIKKKMLEKSIVFFLFSLKFLKIFFKSFLYII